MVTALTVNYNTPEYLERLLTSFRQFYPDVPYVVIDGSNADKYARVKDFPTRFGVTMIHFNYNIHHGPGMAYALRSVIRTPCVLLMDSDIIIHAGGWLEMMKDTLRATSYGMGDIQKEYYLKTTRSTLAASTIVRRHRTIGAQRAAQRTTVKVWVDYLHPVLALVNREVMLKYHDPIKGGAPLIEAMRQIDQAGQSSQLLQRADWLTADLWQHLHKYVQHNHNHAGMGTVTATGGYHL